MKKIVHRITIIFLVSFLFFALKPVDVDASANNSKFSTRDLAILENLQKKSQKLNLKEPTAEELESLTTMKVNKKSISNKDIVQENKRDKNKIYVQIFDGLSNEQILARKLNSLSELENIEIIPSPEIVEENKEKPYYSVSYYIIISTPKYTGSYSFDRFYINELDKMTEEAINQVVEYNKINNLDKDLGKRQIVNTLFLLKENAFPTFCQKGINYFFDLI